MRRRFGLGLCVLAVALPLLAACGPGQPPEAAPEVSPTPMCSGDLCLYESSLSIGTPKEGAQGLKPRAVEGLVVNEGNSTLSVVEITVALYDEKGEELRVVSKKVTDLEAGQRWKFSILLPGTIDSDVRSYKILSLTGS